MVAMREVSPESIRSDLYWDSSTECRNSPSILSVLSSLLERVVARNQTVACVPAHDKKEMHASFYGSRVPSMSIEEYLERIFKYAHCSPSCFVLAYVYMDRAMHRRLPITSLTVHRLLIASVMAAAKFLDDTFYGNAFYAKIGGVTTQDMNKLELDFLFLLDFRLQVTVSVFESYCSHLEREVALGGGYQIERTLKSICGLDKTASQEEIRGKLNSNINRPSKRLGRCHNFS